jgi:CheY-like chemotaxis protein
MGTILLVDDEPDVRAVARDLGSAQGPSLGFGDARPATPSGSHELKGVPGA